jgi:signal transduction histidine kinase
VCVRHRGATVREVLERQRLAPSGAGCTVSAEIAPGATRSWDRARIEQALTHLLANAIRYAPGLIEVRVGIEDAIARLEVRDHGPGIGREDRERVFLAYERAVSHLGARGFGIGLYTEDHVERAAEGRAAMLRSASSVAT